MSPQLLAIFSNLVEEAAGLHYGPRDQEVFASKVVAHASDAGFDSLLDYYYRLRYDDADGSELRRLVEVLVVHETYFFRELPPLVALVDGHLADTCRRRGRARVWSAACATGEEPLTLAMLLDARGLLDQVELVATDVSASAIERARSGQPRRRALRDGHPADLAQRYLDVTEHGLVVAPRILEAVQFSVLNLLDAAGISALGRFDAILCRNVLIYFREAQIVRVVQQLVGALAPGGLLAVGVAESLLRLGTNLVCEERDGCFFYRRAP
jgi:chemotaxis protein methyltransferase CheR